MPRSSCWPISAAVTCLSRKASTVGREKMLTPLILESSVMMSSVMPSRKYSSSFTPLRFSKYRTAMDFSAMTDAAAPLDPPLSLTRLPPESSERLSRLRSARSSAADW
jgi:hypothetical protein